MEKEKFPNAPYAPWINQTMKCQAREISNNASKSLEGGLHYLSYQIHCLSKINSNYHKK